MAHSYVWHASFVYVMIGMCTSGTNCWRGCSALSYAWHDSFIRVVCVIWLIHTCDMTHSYLWYDSFISLMFGMRTSGPSCWRGCSLRLGWACSFWHKGEIFMQVYTYIYASDVFMYILEFVYIDMYIYICIHIYIYIHIYVYTYVYTYILVYIYICLWRISPTWYRACG